MAKHIKTIYQCDCCKADSEKSNFLKSSLKLEVHQNDISEIKKDLCFQCQLKVFNALGIVVEPEGAI